MDADDVLRIGQEALYLSLVLSAPAVVAALLVGTVVAIFQAATQLQENTLSIVPKIVVVFAVLAATGLWAITQLIRFTTVLWESILEISA